MPAGILVKEIPDGLKQALARGDILFDTAMPNIFCMTESGGSQFLKGVIGLPKQQGMGLDGKLGMGKRLDSGRIIG